MISVKIYSIFLMTLEIWGSLYFFDTFLQAKKTGKLQKYRFFIWFVGIQTWSFALDWNGWWRCVPIVLACIFLCLFFYRTSILQSIFLAILNYCLILITDFLTVMPAMNQPHWVNNDMDSTLWYCLMALTSKMLWITLLLLIRKIGHKREEDYTMTNGEWVKLSIIPIITLSAILAMLFSHMADKKVQTLYLMIAIGMIVSNLVVIHLMQTIGKKEKALRVSMLINQKQENQLAAYAEGNKVYAKQQKKMHDYKNQLATIQTLIKSRDYETALDFVEKLTESISVDMSAINTNHPVVNAILNQKYRSAKEKNISMSLKLGDLHDLSMKEEDIVIILGNLLDNAMEECEALLKEGQQSVLIFLKMVYEDGRMILSVKNPVRKKVEIMDNVVQKDHENGHGIGLLNVKSLVEQYEGDLVLSCDEKEFMAVIML